MQLFTMKWNVEFLLPRNLKYTVVKHYNDVTISAMAPQITSLTIVYSAVYSGTDQRKTSKVWVTGLCSIPRAKGQWCGKVFHLMTSSWIQWRQPESKLLQSHKQFCWICWHCIHFYINNIQEGCGKISINAFVSALFEAQMQIMYLKTCNLVKSIRVFYNVILDSLKHVLICIQIHTNSNA